MKAPLSWLKDFVDISVSPQTLAKKLVAIGFEVEGIEYQNKKSQKVFVSKIISVDKHPNADRLSVCKVQLNDKILDIVTNAKVESGEFVPLAVDGAILATGQKITAGEIRGVHSDGMFCGGEELALCEDDIEGASKNDVLRLPGDFKTGENVYDAIGHNDVILDVAITANRPDCNSIFNLSKEVAVALKQQWKTPNLQYVEKNGKVSDMVEVKVENQQLCPRYMAAGVKNIKIKQSDLTMRRRLRAVGIRPINNIVDITNYVLIELGQPMHAFDRRELEGNKIIVRTAKIDEKIVSLDGKENTLDTNMLVICDAVKPVAIAGIMGGENSGIKDDTKEIIFESARFARESVRRTSKKLNLRSDSSPRFEKGVDFKLQEVAIKRALSLVNETNSGEVAQGLIDISVDFKKQREVSFTMQKISEILGFTVRYQSLLPILNRLGIEVVNDGKNLKAIIPGEREDIFGVNDIAEEFIRVYGFDKIPRTLFKNCEAAKGTRGEVFEFETKVKRTMASCGLNEIVNYSFTSPKYFEKLAVEGEAIPLINPLGESVSVMRTTLIHSMLETIAFNISKFNNGGRLFEVGNVYLPKKLPLEELPHEEKRLAIGIYGDSEDFFTTKAAIAALFQTLGLQLKLEKEKYSFLHDGRSASVFASGEKVGFVGELHPDTAEKYGLEKRVYIAEISLEKLIELYGGTVRFSELSRFPSVERDLAVVVNDSVTAGEMTEAVMAAKIAELEKCRVFDVFKGEAIGKNKKSVALKFEFVPYLKTMTDDEINERMEKILSVLKKKCGAQIRQ